MTDPDELLMTELRRAAEVAAKDPVPPLVTAAAMAAYTWRTLDAELAALAYDSANEERELAGVRGDESRLLSFSAVDLSMDVEVAQTGGSRSLSGEAAPAPDRLQVQRPGGGLTDVGVDDAGRFRVERIEPGPLRFRLVVADRTLTTAWVSI